MQEPWGQRQEDFTRPIVELAGVSGPRARMLRAALREAHDLVSDPEAERSVRIQCRRTRDRLVVELSGPRMTRGVPGKGPKGFDFSCLIASAADLRIRQELDGTDVHVEFAIPPSA